MLFIESSAFAKARHRHLSSESFRALQNALIKETTRIDYIPGTGGLLKARWSRGGSGKQGGLRVIYYRVQQHNLILLLLLYPKNKQDNLTAQQRQVLRHLVELELKRWEQTDG
ncbi:MAG: type II toxin-antitoxin system RelE/ParE family toxin [Bacteroidota bacterium]